MNVLLVEDDPDVRSMLERQIARLPDVTLDVADNGSRALGMGVVGDYDLILLDLHLPDVGGLDILPMLRSSLPRAVIVVLSGYTDLVTEEDADVADAIITKPFELPLIDELVALTGEVKDRFGRIRGLGISLTEQAQTPPP